MRSLLASLVSPRSPAYDPESLRVRRSDTGLSALAGVLAAMPSSSLVAVLRKCVGEKEKKPWVEWLGYAVAVASIVGVAVSVWATFRPK